MPIIPALLALWAAVETGLSAYDAYDTGKTLLDPNASGGEKLAAGGGFVLGLFVPGGGYGAGAKQGLKAIDNLSEGAEFIVKNADSVGDTGLSLTKATQKYSDDVKDLVGGTGRVKGGKSWLQ